MIPENNLNERKSKYNCQDLLRFKDWLKKEEDLDKDWILLGRYSNKKYELFFTNSVLVNFQYVYHEDLSINKEPIGIILNKESKNNIKYRTNFKKIREFLFRDFYPESSVVNSPFSHPESYLYNEEGDLFSFNDSLITQSGVEYRPLVHLEDLEDKGIRLKLDQKFEQFYNVNLIDNEYKKKDNSGDWEIVATIDQQDAKNVELYVKTRYLRDFVTLSNFAVMRYHSHQRWIDCDQEKEEYEWKRENAYYKIFYGKDPLIMAFSSLAYKKNNSSLLRGIDIIRPYKKPYLGLHELENKYESFVIGIDEHGEDIEMACNQTHGQPNLFLTHIYFKKELLLEYYRNPEKYTINEGELISCGSKWVIPYCEINDVIQVYLGDLRTIPYKEQKLWKRYEFVMHKQIMTKDRYERDKLAKFASPIHPVYQLKTFYRDINGNFLKEHSQKLFYAKNELDSYNIKKIHLLITDQTSEYDEIINSLSKSFIEQINVDLIKNIVPREYHPIETKGTLKWLGSLGTFWNIQDWSNRMSVLYALWDIRSNCVEHGRGENCLKLLKRHKLDKMNYSEIIEYFITNISRLCSILKTRF